MVFTQENSSGFEGVVRVDLVENDLPLLNHQVYELLISEGVIREKVERKGFVYREILDALENSR